MKLQFVLLISTLCPLFGQNVALPINIGYTEPAPFQAAPGTGSHPLSRRHFIRQPMARSAPHRPAPEICRKASQGSRSGLHNWMDLRCRRRSSPSNRNGYVA